MAEINLEGLEGAVDLTGLAVAEEEIDERSTISKALAPTQGEGISIPDSPFLEAAAQTGITALEIIDTPKRLLGKMRGFDVSDPKSALLQPEAEKLEEVGEELSATPPGFGGSGIGPALTGLSMKISAEALREGPTLFVGGTLKKLSKTAKNILKGTRVSFNRFGESISRLSDEAFALIKKPGGVNQLEKAQGTAVKIGEELKTLIFKQPDEFFPERQIVKAAVKDMGDVPLKRTIAKLDKAIKKIPLKEANQPTINRLKQIRDALANGREIPSQTQIIPERIISQSSKIPGQTQVISGKAAGARATIPGQTQKIPGKTISEQQFKTVPGGVSPEGVVFPPKKIPISGTGKSTAPTVIDIPERTLAGTPGTAGTKIDLPAKTIGKDVSIPSTKIDLPAKKVFDQTQTASAFKNNIEALDDFIDFSGAPGAKIINKQLQSIRSTMRRELIRQALLTKNPQFVTAMRKWAKKEDALDALKLRYGANGETFVSTLYGKSKTERQEAFDALEKAFKDQGLKFKARAKLSRLADELQKRDFIEVSPGQFKLGAPRGSASVPGGAGAPGFIASVAGKLISPNTAKSAVNFFEGTLKAGKIPAELTEAGLDAASIGAIINFLNSSANQQPTQ